MSSRRATVFCLAVLLSALLGCGGDNSSYLPQPRPVDDEEEQPVAVASAPAAAKSPVAEASASPTNPSPRPPSPAPPTPPSPGTAAASGETSAPPAAASAPPEAASAAQAAPSSAPPAAPATEIERRRQTIEQLTQIGRVFEAYYAKNGMYPARVVFSLSWRAGILPLAGQTDLYLKFERTAPWDTPQNTRLLSEIPPYLQAAGLETGKTRFVLVAGEHTAYWVPEKEGVSEETCPDGLDNTILAIAIDDSCAVPWTSPQDYVFSRESVQQAFFGLYQDCCYALFGGNTGVRRIPATISDEQLLALLTPSGGEAVSALEVTRPPTAEPDEALLRKLQEQPIVRFVQPASSPATEAAPVVATSSGNASAPGMAPIASAAEPAVRPAASPRTAEDSRLPIPDEVAQQLARRVLRETHHQEYTEATTDERKQKLADKLLTLGRTPELDPPARYVALDLSRRIALEGGAILAAMEALEAMTEAFDTEGFAERSEIMAAASYGRAMPDSDSERVLSEATQWLDQAMQRNELELADKSLAAALTAARRLKEYAAIRALMRRQRELSATKVAWKEVALQLERLLQDPTDAQANEIVGLYYCLINQRWDDGLPLLAQAADPRLQELASFELKRPAAPTEQLNLADRWWTYAESSSKHRAASVARAAHWYRQALDGLPPGLDRIKAESRLAKADPEAGG